MNKPDTESHLLAVLSHVLTPLIRFLLRSGFTYPRLIQLIRKIYVDVAESEPCDIDTPPSTSRISLLTGIARRYIREIRLQDRPSSHQSPKISPSAKLISDWTTQARFIDQQARPLLLPRLSSHIKAQAEDQSTPQAMGAAPSFAELAERASSDIRPRTQLARLLERGLVEVDKNDNVRLLKQAYLPDDQHSEMLSLLADHLHDHIASVSTNVLANNLGLSKQLDRSVFQTELSLESINALQALSEQESMKMLQRIYARASELSQKDRQKKDNTHRFRLGVYAFQENTKPDPSIKK